MLGGFLDAAAGDVEILGVDLDADETAAELDGGNASRAAAHEGIASNVANFSERTQQMFRSSDRENGRMIYFYPYPRLVRRKPQDTIGYFELLSALIRRTNA